MTFVGQTFSSGAILLASELNQMDENIDDVRKAHISNAAPSELTAGVSWIDNAASPWLDQVYDGSQWIVRGLIDDTNNLYHNEITGTVGGTANAITLATSAGLSAYVDGMKFRLKVTSNQTGNVTLNVDSVGIKSVVTPSGSELPEYTLLANNWVTVVYHSTTDTFIVIEGIEPIGAGAVTGAFLTTLPGWLLMDGTTGLDSDTNTDLVRLFQAIGTMFGGTGSNDFDLPTGEGYFMRGLDNGASGIDPDVASRTDRGDGTTGNALGTKQADQYKSHNHSYSVSGSDNKTVGNPESTGANSGLSGASTGSSGGNETRPENIAVNWFIKK